MKVSYDIQVVRPRNVRIFLNKSMLFVQETTVYAPPCQSRRPFSSCKDVILHVRVLLGLFSLIIEPGQKRGNTFRRAIMSPETEQTCYYL